MSSSCFNASRSDFSRASKKRRTKALFGRQDDVIRDLLSHLQSLFAGYCLPQPVSIEQRAKPKGPG